MRSQGGLRHVPADQPAPGGAVGGPVTRAGTTVLRWASGLDVPVWAVLYAVSAVACCALAFEGTSKLVDLHVYRLGASVVLHGGSLYRVHFHGLPFTYPPFAAAVMAPAAWLPWPVVAAGMTAASVAALPLGLWLALRLPPAQSWLSRRDAARVALAAAAAAVWLEPVRSELGFGQIDLLLAAAVIADLLVPRTAWYKGVLIGVAAGVKLTPAIFIVYLVITKRYRAAVTSVAALAATVAIGFAVAPSGSGFYWDGYFLNPSHVSTPQSGQDESLLGAIIRNAHDPHMTAVWLPLAVLVGAAGLALAALAQRSGDEALGFSLCALTGLLVSPISWTHHWVLAIPALLLAAVATYRNRGARSRLATRLSVAAIAAVAVIGWSKIARYPGGHWLYAPPYRVVFSEVYVVSALAGLVVAALVLRHRGQASAAQPP